MGLDTSHGCWHGSYSSFNDWREWLSQLGHVVLPEMAGFGGSKDWDKNDILTVLLDHSDCDGVIKAEDCLPLAERLEELLPDTPSEVMARLLGRGEGWMIESLHNWINGLREAGEAGEDVEFG